MMSKSRTHERLERQRTTEDETAQKSLIQVPESVYETLDTEGQSLDSETRAFMEPRFGHDFSQVRIHADGKAAESARAVEAQAYTVGSDVVFEQGRYAPETQEGKMLLAHELTHVAQQQGMSQDGPMMVGAVNDSYEQEAGIISSSIIPNRSPATRSVANTVDQGQHLSEDASLNLNADERHRVTQATPSSGTGLLMQRETLAQQVADLQQHQQAQDIHQKATDLDLLWRAKFNVLLSSYSQAILRISGGLNTASKNFQNALQKQAETNARLMEVIGVIVTLAGGFEWAFAAGLGKLGMELETAEHIVVPAVHSVIEAGVEIGKDSEGKKDTPEVPSVPGAQIPAGTAGGDPLGFLVKNTEELEAHKQKMEQAFLERSIKTQGYSDDKWMKEFNLAEQANVYDQVYQKIQNAGSGVEKLKDDDSIAKVLERHMWASWIMAHQSTVPSDSLVGVSGGKEIDGLGTDIEVALNSSGVTADAKPQVTLTEKWYRSNSPDDWQDILVDWASQYREGIDQSSKA